MELRSYQDEDTAYQQRHASSHWTNTSKKASTYDWQADLEIILRLSEEAEKKLSYLTTCGSELARKQTGAYYTPADVCAFFWNEFFSLGEISTPDEAANFVNKHSFVEPSVGAGAIVFSLLLKLANLGVDKSTITNIDLTLVDINKHALSFVKGQFDSLSKQWGVNFPNINFVCSDFQKVHFEQEKHPYFFFGNPPFITNQGRESKWNNSFADFVEASLKTIGNTGSLQFILPLSIAFSRDYSSLRNYMLEHDRCISLSHFDNIPDTLFKSGKPKHTNSNKANSQRCSILTIRPSNVVSIKSTPLIHWSKYDRQKILSTSPLYYDITSCELNNQFPRPKNNLILKYLNQSLGCEAFNKLIDKHGEHTLYVSAVARNYVGFRENLSPSTHQLRFNNERDFYLALLILSSDLFFDYWKTIGDGFHVTKGNILNFPLHKQLNKNLLSHLPAAQHIWSTRENYKKSKKNSGKTTFTYDFSDISPSLLVDDLILFSPHKQ